MRYWSILFGLAAVFTVGTFLYAPFSPDWWLPNPLSDLHHVVSTFGKEIDSLFVIILMDHGRGLHRYAGRPGLGELPLRRREGRAGAAGPAGPYFHGSQRLEVVWTIIPAAILVFIALYQMGTWASIKFRSAAPKVQPLAEITARQFQWVMKYPGPDGKLQHARRPVHWSTTFTSSRTRRL